jgi:F-type H+-transporting ATPase subunit delta
MATAIDPNTVDPVTSRYTEALYSLAEKQGHLEAVAGDVERLGSELSLPKVRGFICNPRLAGSERLTKLESVLGGMHELTQKFVRLLFAKNREQVLLGLAGAFRQRRLDAAGIVEGTVESARPLDGEAIDRLASALGARLGKKVHLENVIHPELVGGFRARIGGRMIDMTISGRLARLRDQLLSAPITAG